MGMEATSLSRTLKGMEDKGSLNDVKTSSTDGRSASSSRRRRQARRQIRELVME